jgi:hypothetical protein
MRWLQKLIRFIYHYFSLAIPQPALTIIQKSFIFSEGFICMMLKMSKYDQLRKWIKTRNNYGSKFMKDIIRREVKGSSG